MNLFRTIVNWRFGRPTFSTSRNMTSAVKDNMARAARSQILQGMPRRSHKTYGIDRKTPPRFNHIAWGKTDGSRPEGVIAAGMENGELGIWDPSKIVAHVKCVYVSLLCDGESDVIAPALPRPSYSRITRTPDPFAVWISIPSRLLCLLRVVSTERYFLPSCTQLVSLSLSGLHLGSQGPQ
jgi:hypothetical protein